MLFDEFDKIYIVNLKSRPDRRREMRKQLKIVGLSEDPRVKYFDAIKTPDSGPFLRIGSHGAFLSHLAILKSHLYSDETVLILQDDCNFIPNASQSAIGEDWDMLYGGYHQLDPGDLHQSNIQGAHCMAFRPKAIPLLVEFLETVYSGSLRTTPEEFPAALEQIAPPIDGAIVWFRRLHPEIRTVFYQISYQRSSKTDIGEPSAIDRFPFLATVSRRLLQLARHAKLKFKRSMQTSGAD